MYGVLLRAPYAQIWQRSFQGPTVGKAKSGRQEKSEPEGFGGLIGMARHDAKGRSKGGWGVALHNYMLHSEAWRALSGNAKALYIEFRQRYWPSGNGKIPYSLREMADDLRCHRKTALAACRDLEEKGFIKARTKGHFDCKVRHATEWELTEYSAKGDEKETGGTKDFMNWRPKEEKAGAKNGTRDGQKVPASSKHRGQKMSPSGAENAPVKTDPDAFTGTQSRPLLNTTPHGHGEPAGEEGGESAGDGVDAAKRQTPSPRDSHAPSYREEMGAVVVSLADKLRG